MYVNSYKGYCKDCYETLTAVFKSETPFSSEECKEQEAGITCTKCGSKNFKALKTHQGTDVVRGSVTRAKLPINPFTASLEQLDHDIDVLDRCGGD